MTVDEEALRAIETPTTIVFGEHDWIRPTLDGMAGTMPRLDVHILPDFTHEQVMFSQSFIDLVRNALARFD